MFARFFKDLQGSMAPIFAIAAVPLLGATGAAVDYSRAVDQRSAVQDALDAAALAANRLVGLVPQIDIENEARAFYTSNVVGKIANPPTLAIDVIDGSITLSTTLEVETQFLGVMGLDALTFDLKAKTLAGNMTYEVALVLDNSGSMAGSKIESLKEAAKDLTHALFTANAASTLPDPVKIAVVPFAASVNVGPQYETDANATWLDKTGKNPNHALNFEAGAITESQNRFALLQELSGVSWKGCVESRTNGHDVDDAEPMSADPTTLFVPMFAPDEPDISKKFTNSYLSDNGGNCPSGTPSTGSWDSNAQRTVAQERVCKYKTTGPLPSGKGPNINCTTKPLLPLSKDQSEIETMIDSLQANGMTNIHAGVMWGWYALSPTAPLTEGRAYGAKDNRKILIIMTDGENTYDTYSNMNRSIYGAFNYVKHGHLGTTSNTNSTVVSKMNGRTKAACANIKATGGITVYTIAFKVSDATTKEMLRACASSDAMAFESDDNTELVATFQQIAADISLLRLAQ